jgi:hypothetical protein
MRWFKRLIVSALLILWPLETFAGDAAGSAGAGVRPCVQYFEDYQKHLGVEDVWLDWAQGFMTGLNVLFHEKGHPTKNLVGISNTDQEASFLIYCEQHPSTRFSDAVGFVFMSLPDESPDPEPKVPYAPTSTKPMPGGKL